MKNSENQQYIKLGLTLGSVVAGGLLLFFFLYRFDVVSAGFKAIWRILRPFANGAVIAYILAPLCTKIEKQIVRSFGDKAEKWANGVAILISLLAAMALIWLLVSLVLPQIWASIENIVITFPEKQAAVEEWLQRFLDKRPELLSSMEGYIDQISQRISAWMETKLLPMARSWAIGLGSHVYGFLGALKDLLLGLLISAYILVGRRRFAAQAKLLLRALFSNPTVEIIESEIRFADRMFNGFLVGKLTDSAIVGVLCMIGVSIIGIGPAVLVSAIVGITNIIPFFGPFIGAIPCALLILLESPLKCLYFIIFIIALQQLDGNVIGPLILGDSTGLPSFWVMFAILFFGGLWGVFGMIVGVPLLAVIYDIMRHALYFRLRKKGEEDLVKAYDWDFHNREPVKPKMRWKNPFKSKKKK